MQVMFRVFQFRPLNPDLEAEFRLDCFPLAVLFNPSVLV